MKLFSSSCVPEQSPTLFQGIKQNPVPNSVKFQLPHIQQKITRHAKQENMACNQEKKIEISPEMAEMMKLAGKDVKRAIINLINRFKDVKEKHETQL